MKISVFRGGHFNLHSNETVGWDELIDLVCKVKIGEKNGDYYLRGFCDGPRCDENMRSVDLIIVDGDKLINNKSGCCPPEPVHAVLKALNITHAIYSSFSNDIVNNRHKWRLIVPCEDLVDAADHIRGSCEIVGELHRANLMVHNVTENFTVSQPWYLPRCPEHTIEDFYYNWHDGETYKLGMFKFVPSETKATTVAANKDHFNWQYIFDLFRSGTLHQGIKAASGWLARTTDWADVQIIEHLTELIDICPDKEKVQRARNGEIKKLVEYCRKKSGIFIADQNVSWKSYNTSGAELKSMEFPDIEWAVEGLIPEGLTILAGDEKFGKSLMALDLCLGIALGTPVMGSKECKKGDAIYITLEDPLRRVKERVIKQRDEWPAEIHFVTQIEGPDITPLVDVFDDMILTYPDTRLIVVDVMNHITPENNKSSVSDYQFTNKFLQPLQKWSNLNHVALLLITHKRKESVGNNDNPFNGIMGSKGITSSADTLIMVSSNYEKSKMIKIDHTLPDGFMHVKGREMGNEQFALDFDKEAIRWVFSNEKKTQEKGNINWLLITKILETKKLTRKELTEETKLNRETIKSCISRMKKKNIIEEDNTGKCFLAGREYKKTETADRW